ncbi:MAG: hypothetical protein JXB85_07775 [Anaerolineales bacterium]|nr:hypothetical protein [Anaerolineales bacterium]
MKDPIQHAQQRTVQYDHVDGTPELEFGALFLLVALFYLLLAKVPGLAASSISIWLVMVIFIGGGFLLDRLVKILKERITYPRTGYLAHRREGRPLTRPQRLLIWVGVPLLTVIILVLLFLNRATFPARGVETLPAWTQGFAGLLFSGLWCIAGWKLAMPRYYLIAAVTFPASVALLFSGLDGNLGLALLFGAMSLALFLTGGLTLWKYLRDHPLPKEETE